MTARLATTSILVFKFQFSLLLITPSLLITIMKTTNETPPAEGGGSLQAMGHNCHFHLKLFINFLYKLIMDKLVLERPPNMVEYVIVSLTILKKFVFQVKWERGHFHCPCHRRSVWSFYLSILACFFFGWGNENPSRSSSSRNKLPSAQAGLSCCGAAPGAGGRPRAEAGTGGEKARPNKCHSVVALSHRGRSNKPQ